MANALKDCSAMFRTFELVTPIQIDDCVGIMLMEIFKDMWVMMVDDSETDTSKTFYSIFL